MNAQAALVPFIQRNLEATARFATLAELTFSSSPEAVINRVHAWLLPVVRDYAAQPGPGEYLDTQFKTAVGEDPPHRVIPMPLSVEGATQHPNAHFDRWLDALHDLRGTVQARAASLSPSRAIAIWICAAALTAITGTKPGMLVVPHITQPDAEDVADRQKVALRLSVKTIEALPLYLESWAAAAADAEARVGGHIDSLSANQLNKSRDLAELKHFTYYFARRDPSKPVVADKTSRGMRLSKKMEAMLVSKGFTRNLSEAKEALRKAQIQPDGNSDEANDFQTYCGSVRVKALGFIALRRNGLMRPEVFRSFGPPGKLTDIVKRLKKERVLIEDILALCGPEHADALAAKEKT